MPQNSISKAVTDLMNIDNKGVKDLILPFEASQIMEIPITNYSKADEITWHGTTDGCY